MRICLDLNVWCSAVLAKARGREDTAATSLVDLVATGSCARGPLALVISWGMLERLGVVLKGPIGMPPAEADDLLHGIASLAGAGPALTLGGIGVLAVPDEEDRHVLETCWAGEADILVTSNLRDFGGPDATILTTDRLFCLGRGGRKLLVAHPYAAAAWLAGRDVAGWPA